MVFTAIYWVLVENLRKVVVDNNYFNNNPKDIFWPNMIAASVGGLAAAVATMPLDVVKTRK
jgi:hypothetical protein